MILQSLVELAGREGLIEDPDYEEKRVDFVIRLRPDGSLLTLESRRDEKGKGARIQVPIVPKRAGLALTPSFLFDNAKYVLGIAEHGKDDPRRVEACVEAFVARVREAAQLHDPAVDAVIRFYADLPAQRESLLREREHGEWTGSEWLAFAVEGTEGLVHTQPLVRAFWKRIRAGAEAGDGGVTGRCLVTGSIGPSATLHPNVKRIPGTLAGGAALVSFNFPALRSHGLEQGENAPVSRAASEAYVKSLNWLLEKDDVANRRFRYGVQLSDAAVVVFWTRAESKELDLFADLWNGPKPEQPALTLEAAIRGLEPSAVDDAAFYALALGGNQARVVVRDWFETTLSIAKRNVRRYFEDLALGEGAARTPTLAIWQLLAAIDPPGDVGPPPDLGVRLHAASLKGTPLPREILRHALLRLRVPPDREKNAGQLLHARCALIKATLCGLARRDSGKKHLEVQVSLDEQNTQTAYILGRLFALLEQIQGAALHDVNATIRDRYFGAASTTPAMVFGRLLRLSVHHESKVGGGLEVLFDTRKRAIMRHLEAAPIPSHLQLEDQGLFAVGYYHERDFLIEDRKRRKEEKRTDS